MKMTKTVSNYLVVGEKNFSGKDKVVDYYLIAGDEKIYAFSRIYTHHSYEMCKSGIRVSDLLTKRSRDTGVMRVVKMANRMIPYLIEYHELAA